MKHDYTHTHKLTYNYIILCPQEQSDRLLVMYPATLIILSEENDGLFYKVPLAWIPLHLIISWAMCIQYIQRLYRKVVLKTHYDYRGNFHSTWLVWPHPARTSSLTPSWLKVSTLNQWAAQVQSLEHTKRHVNGFLISVHSYACFTLSGLCDESASVTESNPPWMSWFYPQWMTVWL